MTRTRRVSLPTVQLSDEAADAYDLIQRSQPAVQRWRAARKLLDAEFGQSVLGHLPDGRLILRSSKPLPPTEINDYSEINAQ